MFKHFHTCLRKGSKEDGLRKQLLCKDGNIHPRKLGAGGGGVKGGGEGCALRH